MVMVPSGSARVEDVREFDRVEGPLVLVINRQPLFLAALGSLLTLPPMNARLQFAHNSEEGLEVVSRGSVELVFCEIRRRGH